MEVTHKGQVIYSGFVSKGIILLRIELLEPKSLEFKAGQYLAVLLPNLDKASYYSIASSPNNQLANREVHYFLGCREESELLESDFMQALAEKYSGFHYHPALSHQEDWEGHTGLITEVVDRLTPNDLSEWQAYSAGSPAMVKAVADELIANKDLKPSSFFSDLYTPEV